MVDSLEQKRAQFEEARNLIDAGEANGTIARPRRVLSLLEASRDREWNVEWLEYFIVFNCLMRRKPARTHGLMGNLRFRYEQSGEGPEKFEALATRVANILRPDTLTPHGFVPTFDSQDQGKIISSMQSVITKLETFGFPVFIYAGTLLGLVRAGELIGNDDDVDVAIFLGEMSTDEVAENWLSFKKQLAGAGLLSDECAATNSPAFEITTDCVRVDLFPAWADKGTFSVYPYSLGDIPESDIIPVTKLEGTDLTVPRNAESLLVQSYGEGWRVPDPYFNFSWPNAKKRFECLFRVDYTL